MEIYARQGDLVIEKLKALPSGIELQPGKAVTFAGDSSGHPHTLAGSFKFARRGRETFVRVGKKHSITHGKAGGHKAVELARGIYVVRPLRERGDGSDRAVED